MTIARLLGHCFGDGYIHTSKRYFIYTNSCDVLLEAVYRMVNEEFGNVAKCVRKSIGGIPQIQFSAQVGRELSNMGAPIGAKANNTTEIPDEIMKGDESVKREFLGALCDDEAWIRTEPNSTQICLKVAKLVELEHDLDAYLNQLKHVFNSLGIECSTPKTDRKYFTSKGVKISKRIWITGKQNVIAFAEKIKLNHPEKSSRLRILSAGGVNGEGGCPEHARR